MCVYLSAFGAHTNRDSGGDKVNWQNFTRGSVLRKSVKPPKGYLSVKVDKSQIECRVLNMFAEQWDKIEEFRTGKDPYVGVASAFCGFEVTKESHPEFRQGGKVVELQAGYQSGEEKIQASLRKVGIHVSIEDALKWKLSYRDTHPAVENLWREAGRMISAIGGTNQPIQWGCLEVHTGFILGPNGTKLRYPNLAYEADEKDKFGGSWRCASRKGRVKIYGGKIVENICQWLAWIAFAQDICRIGKESGLWPVIREHDAGTWLIPDNQYAEQTVAWLKAEMSRPPAWMPDIPLDADATLSERT